MKQKIKLVWPKSLLRIIAKMSQERVNGEKEELLGGRLRVVDLRSDTVTTPTNEMRAAMFDAKVGDDVHEDDPTVKLLEEKAAQMLGKESALFVVSGTMGNLISVMVHCSRRGEEVLLGDQSHISHYEQGGVASIGGVHTRTVRNMEDGSLDLEDLKSKLMPDDVHHPCARLVCVENTHNVMGGRVLHPSYMESLAEIARAHNLLIHVDGARIFNAATALGVPVTELVKHADSVSICLSKGLGAPVGSIIVGNSKFIKEARRVRKALGGGLRQVGVLAAPGLIALEKMSLRLQEDHDNAKRLARGLSKMQNLGLEIDLESIETNIVHFSISSAAGLSGHQMEERLNSTEWGPVMVKLFSFEDNLIRAVIHHQVSQEDIDLCLNKVKFVLQNV